METKQVAPSAPTTASAFPEWKYWLAAAVVIAAHLIWFWFDRKIAIGQRAGAALIVLGVWIAARSMRREGIASAVNRQMPPLHGVFLRSTEDARADRERREAIRPEVERDVRAERIVGAWLIGVGTFLTGYADLFLSLFVPGS